MQGPVMHLGPLPRKNYVRTVVETKQNDCARVLNLSETGFFKSKISSSGNLAKTACMQEESPNFSL